MRQKIAMVLFFLLAGVALFGCAPGPNVQTGWEYYPPDKMYTVYGRVQNYMSQPISDVKVVLIRRNPRSLTGGSESQDETVDFLVANTGRGGDYSFQFEPWGAYDVWVYFDAQDQGFVPQMVQLNHFMRSLIARGVGRTPINVDVLLEPIRDEDTRKLVTKDK
ncbi:MAG: hypothetical protein KKB20_01855 [Proteobacteria bacterium]|nr:hypothetical protein [Pseudomonadota bacterium]